MVSNYRTRKITSGVRLKPLERSPTPYAYSGSKKKLKKRRDRKRSSNKDQKKEKSIYGKSQSSFDYNSDLDFFVDDSSNDEGFASGRPTSMCDSISTDNTLMSQFTPRLETMMEEEEDADNTDDNIKQDQASYGNYDQSNISLYEDDVQAYLNSEALKDGQVLHQVEQSWNLFLQPYVSILFINKCQNKQMNLIWM